MLSPCVKWRPTTYTHTHTAASFDESHLPLTFGDNALQVNDVGVVELAHDAGLGQEVSPLLVGVAGLQRLDGHADLPLARHLQPAAAHLAKLA